MPQHTITLESPWKRTRLVPPSPVDDEAYGLCRTHPITRRYLRFLPEHMSPEEARVRREERAEDPRIVDLIIHFIDEDDNSRMAGFSGYFNLDNSNLSCEAGIIVAPEFHNKGLATETFYILLQHIFEDRKLHRTTFETGADNVGMRAWLEKVAGARLEAERKECWKLPDGTFQDVAGYAILEWEWKEKIKKRLEERMGRILA